MNMKLHSKILAAGLVLLAGCNEPTPAKADAELEARVTKLESQLSMAIAGNERILQTQRRIQSDLSSLQRQSAAGQSHLAPQPVPVAQPTPAGKSTDSAISPAATAQDMARQRNDENKKVYQLIRSMAPRTSAEKIAEMLNMRKLTNMAGKAWDTASVEATMKMWHITSTTSAAQ